MAWANNNAQNWQSFQQFMDAAFRDPHAATGEGVDHTGRGAAGPRNPFEAWAAAGGRRGGPRAWRHFFGGRGGGGPGGWDPSWFANAGAGAGAGAGLRSPAGEAGADAGVHAGAAAGLNAGWPWFAAHAASPGAYYAYGYPGAPEADESSDEAAGAATTGRAANNNNNNNNSDEKRPAAAYHDDSDNDAMTDDDDPPEVVLVDVKEGSPDTMRDAGATAPPPHPPHEGGPSDGPGMEHPPLPHHPRGGRHGHHHGHHHGHGPWGGRGGRGGLGGGFGGGPWGRRRGGWARFGPYPPFGGPPPPPFFHGPPPHFGHPGGPPMPPWGPPPPHHGDPRGDPGAPGGDGAAPPPPFDVAAFMQGLAGRPWARHVRHHIAAAMSAAANAARAANAAAAGNAAAAEGAATRDVGDDATANNNNDDDDESEAFSPPVDVFDSAADNAWVVHVAVPGAKKEDVGVSYDEGKRELQVAGIVYRPGDERFVAGLVAGERRIGLFERTVRIPPELSEAQRAEREAREREEKGEKGDDGEKRESQKLVREEVDAANISARMEDGLLIVTIPKLEPREEWTEIRRVDIE